MTRSAAMAALLAACAFDAGCVIRPRTGAGVDLRNIRTGVTIPDEGYCDQPYVVITRDGHWLCTMTTGKGVEGQGGQHVVSTISQDHGQTWSPRVDIEPADGPEASWAMPLVTPSGRVYVFYDYNGDRVDSLGSKKHIRADMLGWYVFKYSDDNGETWSRERYRMPVPITAMDRENDWQGQVQILWGIGKPIIAGSRVYLGFSKIGKYLIEESEGRFLRSDNVLTERDPQKIRWQMVPEGDVGLRAPKGPIAEEQNLVALSGGALYTVYRTIDGHPCHAYSTDGGDSWTPTAYASYSPDGRLIKHPRACPRLWKTSRGNYLLWFHNHGGKNYYGRNPAWITGGKEKGGRVYWSQPEILLYDNDPKTRISYPDLIEQDGRVWVTETQKTIARVHEVDPTLLEGLWKQGTVKRAARRGLLVSLEADGIPPAVKMPILPALREGSGWTVECWVRFQDLSEGQILLDSRDGKGKGLWLTTTGAESVRLEFGDDRTQFSLDADDHSFQPDRLHQIVVCADGGPRIVWMMVDGVLCDGGASRPSGWGRISEKLEDVNGADDLHIGGSLKGRMERLRIYDRPLRVSEAVGNFTADRARATVVR